MCVQHEYYGDVINFKTYSKSFKNKVRLPNPKKIRLYSRMFTISSGTYIRDIGL